MHSSLFETDSTETLFSWDAKKKNTKTTTTKITPTPKHTHLRRTRQTVIYVLGINYVWLVIKTRWEKKFKQNETKFTKAKKKHWWKKIDAKESAKMKNSVNSFSGFTGIDRANRFQLGDDYRNEQIMYLYFA